MAKYLFKFAHKSLYIYPQYANIWLVAMPSAKKLYRPFKHCLASSHKLFLITKLFTIQIAFKNEQLDSKFWNGN